MDINGNFRAQRSDPPKRYATRLVTWKAKNRYQVNFGYGVKNRRIGAAATINPPHPPKEKNGKQSEKKSTQKREGSSQVIWSPTAAANSTIVKHPLTHSPTQKRKKKSEKSARKQGRKGSNSLIRRPTAVSSILLIVLLYRSSATAVEWHISTTAAAVRKESDLATKPQITKSLKRKKTIWILVQAKKRQRNKKKLKFDPKQILSLIHI